MIFTRTVPSGKMRCPALTGDHHGVVKVSDGVSVASRGEPPFTLSADLLAKPPGSRHIRAMPQATNFRSDLALEACACGTVADTRPEKMLRIGAASKAAESWRR